MAHHVLVMVMRPRAKEMKMKTTPHKWNGVIVAGLVTVAGGVAVAQQQQQQPPQQQQRAPVVGAQPIGVTVQEDAIVAQGWSSKKDLVGKPVYNDQGQKIGNIEDVIISPDRIASFAIIGAGGFVGLSKHTVVIPFKQLQLSGSRMVLPGATKDAIKSLPEFVYAR
jgi:sporulation protein YlmC with PRC-barrel domain